ncbi:MAG: chemotaxis response regulator protein-glutamate methylesterase [Anaerolineae bacterium]
MSTPVKVLVVDDSPFMRYTIAKHLAADPDIVVVGSAQDGVDALSKIPALAPDVVTLDVEMPRMDGLTTLEHIMTDCPTPVVMLSSLTQRGTRTTIQALMRGAVDFVAKPTTSTDIRAVIVELSGKIKAAAGLEGDAAAGDNARPRNGSPRARTLSPPLPLHTTPVRPAKLGLRPFKETDPVVVIGASTGGPRALHTVMSGLPADLPAAILIVQHMPPGFTRSLAQRLNDISAITVQEATGGDRLALGLALLAPGDFHMRLKKGKQIELDQGPRRNHVRPAVDVTMETAVETYRSNIIGVVLTGMGSDGAKGAALIKQAGGRVIAEDESTSVVYGMPRSVIEAKLADVIAPLPDVAEAIVEMVTRGRN